MQISVNVAEANERFVGRVVFLSCLFSFSPCLQVSFFCSVLFCSVLFCSVLFCSVLFCSVLFCSVLFCFFLFFSFLFLTFPFLSFLFFLCLSLFLPGAFPLVLSCQSLSLCFLSHSLFLFLFFLSFLFRSLLTFWLVVSGCCPVVVSCNAEHEFSSTSRCGFPSADSDRIMEGNFIVKGIRILFMTRTSIAKKPMAHRRSNPHSAYDSSMLTNIAKKSAAQRTRNPHSADETNTFTSIDKTFMANSKVTVAIPTREHGESPCASRSTNCSKPYLFHTRSDHTSPRHTYFLRTHKNCPWQLLVDMEIRKDATFVHGIRTVSGKSINTNLST